MHDATTYARRMAVADQVFEKGTGSAEITADERARIQRRTLWILALAVIPAGAATTGSISVAILIAEDLLGSSTWAGLVSAASTAGASIAAVVLARIMDRSGRRPGLRAGYISALGGSVVALIGVLTGSLLIFLVGMVLLGGARASNLQARFAAADLADPDHRARAISMLVWTGTIGAVSGPLLIGLAKSFAESIGLTELAGPYIFAIGFLTLASLVIGTFLRPDPLVVAGNLRTGTRKKRNVREALSIIRSRPMAIMALGTMMGSQAVMAAVMTMTPSHMREYEFGIEVIGYVFSAHIFGMYGLAPLTGLIADRVGRVPTAMIGAVILIVATVMAALAGDSLALLFPALFLLGWGWNFGLISGSALLTESVPLANRVTVQGSADMLMTICGGVAGLSSGLIKSAFSYAFLGNLGTAVSVAMLIAVASVAILAGRRRAPEPAA